MFACNLLLFIFLWISLFNIYDKKIFYRINLLEIFQQKLAIWQESKQLILYTRNIICSRYSYSMFIHSVYCDLAALLLSGGFYLATHVRQVIGTLIRILIFDVGVINNCACN